MRRPLPAPLLALLLALVLLPACYDPHDQARGFAAPLPGNRSRYIEETHDPAPLEEAPINAVTGGPVPPAPLPPPQAIPKAPPAH